MAAPDVSALISEVIEGQRTLASESADLANNALSSALGGGLYLDTPNTILPDLSGDFVVPSGTLPTFISPDFNFGSVGAVPDLNIRSIDTTFTAPNKPDALVLPERTAPSISIPNLDAVAPSVDLNFTIPDAPVFGVIDLPSPIQVTLPDSPSITIADFVGTDISPYIPGDVGDAQAEYATAYDNALPEMKSFLESIVDDWIVKYSPEYHTAMSKLEDKIALGIDGGTAMSDTIEQQIYDRAKDRAEAERARAEDELLEGMSRRGYSLPPSAISAGLVQIQQATSKNISGVAAETAIARAKLEQEHAQFIMNLSSTMHLGILNTAMQYAGTLANVNNQAMEYAKTSAGLMVTQYNLMLDKLKSIVAVAQTEAAVYDAKLKASMADITIFEAEIRAAELSKNIEKIDIDLYTSRIKARESDVQIYLAQIQAIQASVAVEKAKVEIYGEEVKAYSSTVQASMAELEVFKAVLSGDEAKARLYAAEVQGYSAAIGAEKAKTDVQVDLVKADAVVAQAAMDGYKAEVAGFVAHAQALSSANGANSDAYRAQIEAYKADRTIAIKNTEAQLSVNQLQAQSNIASMEAGVRVALTQQGIISSYLSSKASTAVAAGSIWGSMAGVAMGGTNTMVTAAVETTG